MRRLGFIDSKYYESGIALVLLSMLTAPVSAQEGALGHPASLFDQYRGETTAVLLVFGALLLLVALLLMNIIRRRQAERELRSHRDHLEFIVAGRTAELRETNAMLQEENKVRLSVERDLAKQRDFLTAVLDTAGTIIAVLDADGCVIRINRAFAFLAGISTAAAQGRKFKDLAVLDDRQDRGQTGMTSVEDEEELTSDWTHFEGKMRARDGSERNIAWSRAHILDEGGFVRNIIVSGMDITERERASKEREQLEERLAQAQKMEAVGQLAGGVAHDFNNLLQGILGYASLVADTPDRPETVTRYIGEVIQAAERAARVVKQLLAFSRRDAVRHTPVDMREAVEGVTAMLSRIIGDDISLDVRHEPESCIALGDTGQLEQVILNLCVNARDAMPDGGVITITTGIRALRESDLITTPWARPGVHAILSVQDTGRGIPREIRVRIFEPFFTTKEAGKGTGLGLSTVYGIAEQHNGFVTVESEVGKGSLFTLYLPLAHCEVEAKHHAPVQVLGPQGDGETILLAEDESVVRHLARDILSRGGYTVISARDGDEALAIWKVHRGEIHLALLDVAMPKRSGKQVADTIRANDPGLPIVFCTGYDFNILDAGPIQHDAILLQKPYRPFDLLRCVRRALDANA